MRIRHKHRYGAARISRGNRSPVVQLREDIGRRLAFENEGSIGIRRGLGDCSEDVGYCRPRPKTGICARLVRYFSKAPSAGLARLSLEHPVGARVADCEQIADRNVKPDPIVMSAGFKEENPLAGIR